ncbi:CPBP family intramembrane glutamic endopeptidase [Leptolyngbya sp. PCC 6406]|uniref:CPBP family intramembrane glutamic endopeptidase n=1 Tax=Leptolyngbya sp. PCC 6406 TaxID=1173264 RepID=UPI0002DD0D0A|nr:CPBP family intramembrane glutamic endopeptidase [Leptolyngbya sp. PCC 6406]
MGFLAGLILVSLPVTLPLYWLEQREGNSAFGIGILLTWFGLFLVGVGPWLRRVHGLKHPWQRLGLYGGKQWGRAWVQGMAVGIVGVAALYGLQIVLGWGGAMPLPANMGFILLEGSLAAVVVGLAEELVFRGWLLLELEADYGLSGALGVNSLLFALVHYIRPWEVIVATWPQFVGLVLLGVTLVWARRSPLGRGRFRRMSGALALPAGLHGGLVWAYYQVSVANIVQPTGVIPNWATGIDGNPLAGVMGLVLLGAIAVWFYRRSRESL